jgi:hypothetical protein
VVVPTEDNVSKITSDCGWLSPAGTWHPCSIEAHEQLARDLLEQLGEPALPSWRGGPEVALENLGWAKLVPRGGYHPAGFAYWGWDHCPTPRQARVLLEWCLGDGQGLTELPSELAPDHESELAP